MTSAKRFAKWACFLYYLTKGKQIMNTLSKEKLNFQKSKKNLTNLKISQLTGIPISNIDKIFSGTNKNPTLSTLQKIAEILDCSIDDFIEYKNAPVMPLYIDKQTETIANEIAGNESLKKIFKNLISLKEDDLKLFLNFSERLKK